MQEPVWQGSPPPLDQLPPRRIQGILRDIRTLERGSPGGIAMKQDLERETGITSPEMEILLEALRREGLIAISSGELDEAWINLTEEGRAYLERASPSLWRRVRALLRGFG